MEGGSDLFDGFHDGQILFPEAERDGALCGTREALEQLDELPVLEF
jgi:hypothetical protein